ncbi:response regulator [Treponema sp.]|uniref:response regulator n=1 Tax=Treponema sp. TaxID=166 RepID=UPI00298E3874|nr:response regulator [Treponema sp.]MCQ2240871.1 response regulator [Treponema sp.]
MKSSMDNSDTMDVLNQIRIPLSDITGISRLLKYNLNNMDSYSEAQINAMLDLVNALDENTSHILSLLNENLENEYEERSGIAVPKADLSDEKFQYKNLAGKKILVVDDIELNRVLVGLMLKNINIEVTNASNGHDALSILNDSQKNEYDLVLMDIMMPVMDGYTATSKIRESKREDIAELPVIAVTANAFEYYKKQAEDYGMNGYVTKPLSKENLYEEISRALNVK